MYDTDLEQFIAFNLALESLTIHGNGGLESNFIHSIGKHLLQLIELNIRENRFDQENIDSLGRLSRLKSFTFGFMNSSVALLLMRALVNGNVPIEQLKLVAGSIDNESVKYLAQLKETKTF